MRIVTFGYRYKRQTPLGADIVLDARCLKEDPAQKQVVLRALTGKDDIVRAYLDGLPDVQTFVHAAIMMVKATVMLNAIAIGCHSGRHRSVYVAESLYNYLTSQGFVCELVHLDMDRLEGEDNAPDFV